MSKVRVIVTHGTGGSPEGNWFPWLSAELQKRGVAMIVPRYPTLEGQNLKNWLSTFEAAVGLLTPDDVLIGHSIGAAFTLRLLERSTVKIRAALLVAGFARLLGNPEFDPYNATFVTPPFDWAKIRESAATIKCYSGADDPYVPISFSRELEGALNTRATIIEKGGHLNAQFGFKTFPLLLEEMEKILDTQAAA